MQIEPKPATSWRIKAEPVLTTLFRAWWRISRPMTLGVRAVICDAQNRVLLVRHTYLAGWYLPGGGVEHGETAATAIVREVAEEAGMEAQAEPVLIGLYSNHVRFKNDHIALYRIDTWRRVAPHRAVEIAELDFFAPDQPPPETTPGTLRRLAEVFAGAPMGPHW